MSTAYSEFIASKSQLGGDFGFTPTFMPDCLFDFQRYLVDWSVRKGRSAIFADCGFGKSLMELVWGQNVVCKENKPVLLATPLAVSIQMVDEGAKFGIECYRARDGKFPSSAKIIVTNYEQLHKFDSSDFCAMICDESGILKNFEGATKSVVTEFMRRMKYRLLGTATPAPNDYIELGTSSEALGYLGYMDMLGMFFKNDQNSLNPSKRGRHNDAWYGNKWRFKPHAEINFWPWMCSWARACRKPSDLGFDDGKFILPPLEIKETITKASRPMDGWLFVIPARGLKEQRLERRSTIQDRCEVVAGLVDHKDPAVTWCHLNPEGDLLAKIIPGAVQVSGRDSDDEKEEKFHAFSSGQIRVLVTKPKIGAWGLNWQHCSHTTVFPSHSYEQLYQLIRRFWRFGQTRKVTVDMISTEGEADVTANMKRKSDAAERMLSMLVECMSEGMSINRANGFKAKADVPGWLQ